MKTYAQTYLPRLQAYQQEMLQRLALLVNIDSGSGQSAGINQVMYHLQGWLSELDCSVELHPVERFGQNLVARYPGKLAGGRPRILLVGHVDTVYAAGSVETHPFRLEDERAYGPGVIDMKSGVLQGIYALRVLREAGFTDFGELCLVFNNDEEVGSPGSAPLLRELASESDFALVLEPSRSLEIVTNARKGADRYILEITGVPAHSGAEPHRGRSAVIELAYKMLAIHQLHTIFPGVTFNVTRLSSSEALNVIPEFARCYISVRAYNEELLNRVAETLEQLVVTTNVPGTQASLTRLRGRVPYQPTPQVAQLVEFARLEAAALGIKLVAEGKGGVSDANLLMHLGVPTLDSLGAIGGRMHDIEREFLEPASLVQRGALLAGLIQRLCLEASLPSER